MGKRLERFGGVRIIDETSGGKCHVMLFSNMKSTRIIIKIGSEFIHES